jgi:hypothetical protein
MSTNIISMQKTLPVKETLDLVLDRDFKFFTQPETPSPAESVEEFFKLYDSLYTVIPIDEPTNSHRYLVEQSMKLVTLDADIDNLQPLLDEISQLREQLLNANMQILDLENKTNS